MIILRRVDRMDLKKHAERHAVVRKMVSVAEQSQKEESDINNLVKRFGITGNLPTGRRAPVFGDFTGVADYRTLIERQREAEASFMSLPAEARKRFQNDLSEFVAFCSDDANADELKRMGLCKPVVPVVEPPVMKVHVVNPEDKDE